LTFFEYNVPITKTSACNLLRDVIQNHPGQNNKKW
jgi:hypothetical protein